MPQPHRINRDKLPPQAYQTYQVTAPLTTHWRDARCEEVGCPNIEHGWRTVIDESTELGQKQAWFIRNQAGRAYTETREGPLTTFTFPAGQQCFAQHKVPLERPALYLVRGGDHRGNPERKQRIHTRPEFWVEDFAEHQDKLASVINKG